MADGFTIGGRYRDTTTGHHVLFLYGPLEDAENTYPELAHFDREWGYIVTSQPDGTLSEDMGTARWTADRDRYLELPHDIGTVLAELRNVIGVMFDEVDPNEEGDWDADRLPALALASVILFAAVDDHLQGGGCLPLEWNPYVIGQPCRAPHNGCHAYDDPNHCRCSNYRCDGRHKCPCGHTWGAAPE